MVVVMVVIDGWVYDHNSRLSGRLGYDFCRFLGCMLNKDLDAPSRSRGAPVGFKVCRGDLSC